MPRPASLSRFPKYLVFYRPITDGIEVIRVLHGARDLDGILADEFGVAIKDDAGSDDEAIHPSDGACSSLSAKIDCDTVVV